MLIGVTFALVFLLSHLDGGIGAIFTAFAAEHKFLAGDQPIFDPNIFRDSVFIMIVGAGFNTMGSYVSSQDIVQRFTTTTDTKKLNKMMLTNGALSIFIATVFYLIGTGLYVFYQQNALPPAAAQDQIFASYIAFELPVGVTGLLLAAIYAASQSTLSTGLNSVAASWTLDIQARLTKKELSFEKQTKIGQYVSLIVGIFAIVVSMVLANGGVKSAYEWFNGFMGLVLGILIGTFILGAFTKVANTFGTTLAFIAASAVMIYIKYGVPAGTVSIWSYSLISVAVSLVVGIPASMIWRKIKRDTFVPAPNTTIYKNYLDVHLMLHGTEQIDLNFIHNMKLKEFVQRDDFLPMNGEKNSSVILRNGDFLICYPSDGHRTAVAVGESQKIKKAIFKVRIS